jgi:hypothetical protein
MMRHLGMTPGRARRIAGAAFYVDCLASHDRFPFLPLGAAGFLSCFATFSNSASIARGCASSSAW